MSYIRGALPFLIYNPNTRDDIAPDGISASFELSQEVPGGYENNVQVIRREFKFESLITSCVSISFDADNNAITCDVPAIAAALSTVSAGDVLKVEGSTESQNNGNHVVQSVQYDGESITFVVDNQLVDEAEGEPITLTRKYVGPWEVIEPIVDYTIGGVGDQTNKVITFTRVPQEEDVIYVMHRGEATYNFVPSEKSVGPDQLSENLRNFRIDVFVGTGTDKDFELSQTAVNARALEVSVDGTLKYGTDYDLQFLGDFELLADGKTISFNDAPDVDANIYVRHLGFSTVSRRQTLSPSQLGSVAPKSIGTSELQNGAVTESIIEDSAVTGAKIRDGAVDGSKILLENNQWLNWKSGSNPNSSVSVVKVDSSNNTTIKSSGTSLSLNVNDTKVVQITTDAIVDTSASSRVSLGSTSNPFSDGYLSGKLSTNTAEVASNLKVGGNAQVTGDVTVSGNITVSGSVDGIDVSALQAQVTALAALVSQNTPAGSIKMWANNTEAPTGYLLCDGRAYSTSEYPGLFSAIGYAFGGSGLTFSVPDFRGRFPLGKAASGTGSGWGGTAGRGGSLDHTHSTPNHTHGLANHVHAIPSHYHSVLANNSTLNITSSGGHTTAIDHTHGAITSGAGSSHTHSFNLYTSGANDGRHAHSGTFGSSGPSVDLSHFHYGTTFGGEGAHRHMIERRGSSGSTHNHDNDSTDPNRFATQPEGGGTTNEPVGYTYGGNYDGIHTHNLVTNGYTYLTSSNALTNLDHTHATGVTFTSDGPHSHTITGSITGESAHTHTVTIPAFTNNSASPGTHTHPVTNFAGALGDVLTGSNGDASFSSGPPSPNLTDQGGASVTGDANPAFQTINFIIKT
jgi:microcystin-dependent protein